MATRMKAVQVARAGGDLELVERAIPEPGAGQVRIRVEACGVCHSDSFVKEGLFPGLTFPRVPGHEVAGRVDKLGPGVRGWAAGDRVGVGWHGGHCFVCPSCRAGDFITCATGQVTGISHDGGYAEYMVSPAEALARIPDGLTAVEAAPLLCAGVTTFNALRHSGARPGDTVAVQGIGGLGHLAVQFAHKSGFRTVAISKGKDKEKLARDLGADLYLDTSAVNVAEELARLGGAQVILATAPDSASTSPLLAGLAVGGSMVVVGVSAEPLAVPALVLIAGVRAIRGWASGHAKDSEETMSFCALTGVRATIEAWPLEKAGEAYARMMAGKARFREVLKIA